MSGIEYDLSVRVSWEDLRALSPEQCEAFMLGLAKVLSANPYAVETSLLEHTEKEPKLWTQPTS